MKSMLKVLLCVAASATISSVAFADNVYNAGACPAVQSGHGTYYGAQGGAAVINLCSMGDTNYSVVVTLTNNVVSATPAFVYNKTATNFQVNGGGTSAQTFDWVAVHN